MPHPDGLADARVVDEQLRDPAGYWLKWLGLTARPRTRLAIARKVAATRLGDPFAGGGGELLEAADIAYRQTIDSTVQAALGRQVELEQSCRSVDSELSTVRANLLQTLDQTVLRAIVGQLLWRRCIPGDAKFGEGHGGCAGCSCHCRLDRVWRCVDGGGDR